MKGDFSRIRFEPHQHYTDVLDQQGRVAYDADHNEQRFIDRHRRTIETVDVIGEYGAPMHDAGFAIGLTGTTLSIGAGRYYVHGLVCENDAALSYDEQPFLTAPADLTGVLEELWRLRGNGCVQVFLEVWQRMITALDDGCLGEPALGQADTTVRMQTVWRVVANLTVPDSSSQGGATLLTRTRATGVRIAGTIESDARAALIRNQVARTSLLFNNPAPKTGLAATGLAPDAGVATVATAADPQAEITKPPAPCSCDAMYAAAPAVHSGTLSAQVSTADADCGCQPIPAAGYTGLENQLYRIEVQRGGTLDTATFKWSRENGSVVVPVHRVSGNKVTVTSLGMDANLGFKEGEWVELSDDTDLFGDIPDQPGLLYKIQQIDRPSMTLTMTMTVQPVDPARHARMRRWDQAGTAARATGVALSANWITLENGIQIRFNTGTYYAGDAWTIAARTATGQIDWPPCGSDGNPFQPPHYTHVYRAPLACIHANVRRIDTRVSNASPFIVDDCRRLFPDLADLGRFVAAQALRVMSINWLNDDVMTFDTLVAKGLQVQLNAAPTGPLSPANFIVSLETPLPLGSAGIATNNVAGAALPLKNVTVVRFPFVLDSAVALTGTTLSWTLPVNVDKRQYAELTELDRELASFVQMGSAARARVKLPGRVIYALNDDGTLVYLDGQVLGQTGTPSSGTGQRIDFVLPSGEGARASDFESWFYLYPALAVESVKFIYNTLTVAAGDDNGAPKIYGTDPTAKVEPIVQQATITLNYAAVQAATIQLSMTGDASIASVPSSAAVAVGDSSITVNVSINGVPKADSGQTFTLTASLPSALGQASSLSDSFTILGRGGRVPVNVAPTLTLDPQAATADTKDVKTAKAAKAKTRRTTTKPSGQE